MVRVVYKICLYTDWVKDSKVKTEIINWKDFISIIQITVKAKVKIGIICKHIIEIIISVY